MTISTTTAPVLEGHDGLDATCAAVVATPSTPGLAATRTAHAAAIENHQQAQGRAGVATAAHRKAIADKEALLTRAAAGEQVNQMDLTRAGVDVAMARDAVDLADTIARGAGTMAERSHVATLQAEADHLTAGYDRRVQERIEAAKAVDRQWAEFNAALTVFNDSNFDISVASTAIRLHNSALASALTRIDPGLLI